MYQRAQLLGDLSGVPYQVSSVQDGPNTTLGLASRTDQVQVTGLKKGGEITYASTTTVDWTAGSGQVADYVDPENVTITDVT